MSKIIAATAIGLSFMFSLPALAADEAACRASWTKMDAKNAGYVMSADNKEHVDAMAKANMKMAAADRISAKEYMDACVKNLFENMK